MNEEHKTDGSKCWCNPKIVKVGSAQPKTARNKRIVLAHKKGMSFRYIAEKEDLSLGRVYKIWTDYNDRWE